MESSDREIVIEIDGQVYRLQGTGQVPQQEVLRRLDGIESRMGAIESRVGALENGQARILTRIDTLTTAVYWVLGAIGIFLAGLGIFTGVYLWVASARKESPSPTNETHLTPSEVIRIVKEVISVQPNSPGR